MTGRSIWIRARTSRSPYVLDGLIAAGLTALVLLSLFGAEHTPVYPREPDAFAAALDVVGAGALVWRRRWPATVFGVSLAATATVYVAGYPDHALPLAIMFALYTLASRSSRRKTMIAFPVLVVVMVSSLLIADTAELTVAIVVGNLAVFGMAVVWGDRKQVRDAYYEQLELREADRERERRETAERAVDEERIRIARELHDVVAHAMSVVAVQSGVGAHVIDTRPAEAKRILETISGTSRDAMNEMRRLLGVLRQDAASPEPLAPAPGLAGLVDLAARVTEAGVPVRVDVHGAPASLQAGIDLTAYRIVQEALTNVLRHAGTASATVTVRHEPGAVHLEVVDDGRGAAAPRTDGGGHGLVGMRERAALYDGTLEAGPRPGGGFRVATTLRSEASVTTA